MSHFISWLSMIVRVNVVLNRTVVVDSVKDVNLYMLRSLPARGKLVLQQVT